METDFQIIIYLDKEVKDFKETGELFLTIPHILKFLRRCFYVKILFIPMD